MTLVPFLEAFLNTTIPISQEACQGGSEAQDELLPEHVDGAEYILQG